MTFARCNKKKIIIPTPSNKFPDDLCSEILTLDQLEVLKTCTRDKKNTTLDGLKIYAKVVYCYDGDSVWVKFYHNGELIQNCVRMYGYDSCEMKPHRKGRTDDSLKNEKTKANEDLQFLVDIIRVGSADMMVYSIFHGPDKFGRQLATFYTIKDVEELGGNIENCKSINQQMIDGGHGTAYFGKTKKSYDQ